MGFLLMNIGEMGNFISYAFAPASVVAPLGTVRFSFQAPKMEPNYFSSLHSLQIVSSHPSY